MAAHQPPQEQIRHLIQSKVEGDQMQEDLELAQRSQ